mmetsp:Transcript_149015/g.211696  ORF Transcript_149015/g.211696 Transcript_149015/m.211696 type:complete len:223 (+) Transcript_149015:40-708(+)
MTSEMSNVTIAYNGSSFTDRLRQQHNLQRLGGVQPSKSPTKYSGALRTALPAALCQRTKRSPASVPVSSSCRNKIAFPPGCFASSRRKGPMSKTMPLIMTQKSSSLVCFCNSSAVTVGRFSLPLAPHFFATRRPNLRKTVSSLVPRVSSSLSSSAAPSAVSQIVSVESPLRVLFTFGVTPGEPSDALLITGGSGVPASAGPASISVILATEPGNAIQQLRQC